MWRIEVTLNTKRHYSYKGIFIDLGPVLPNLFSVQFSSIQFNSIQFSSIQFSSDHFSSDHFSSVQLLKILLLSHITIHFSSVQFSSVQISSVQISSIQFRSVQFSSVQLFYAEENMPLLLRRNDRRYLYEYIRLHLWTFGVTRIIKWGCCTYN